MQIRVHSAVAAAREPWLALQESGLGTFYQTYQWCLAWQRQIGSSSGIEPRIAIGLSPEGTPLFVLPLAVRRTGGAAILQWLGSPHINYGWGIYHRSLVAHNIDAVAAAWPRIIRACGAIDAVHLAALPSRWRGVPHPLSPLITLTGPNHAYLLRLSADFEALYASKRSGPTRRRNRKREQRLEAAGALEFGLPPDREAARRLLDHMLEQQATRLGEMGIASPYGDTDRAFLGSLTDLDEDGRVCLLPYHLTLDGRFLAAALGGLYDRTYWALVSSLAGGPERQFSPGEVTIRRTIAACCRAGLEWFDFGAGDADYKRHWADEVIPLNEVLQPLTWRGIPWTAMTFLRLIGKRAIKRTPRLWAAVRATRARLYRGAHDRIRTGSC